MQTLPNCPECNSEYTYNDGTMFVCPECGFEWTEQSMKDAAEANIIRDANGNELNDGDSVAVIRDLKINGSSSNVVKVGTKAKNIRLIHDAPDDHDISCKIDGFGAMKLKSSVVKKI